MQTTPSGTLPDSTDDFNDAPNKNPDNLVDGTDNPHQMASTAPSGTPQYGDFGHAPGQPAASGQQTAHAAGTNPGGQAAPSTIEPEQRGSTPQNLNPEEVRNVKNDDYEDQREGWAKDDPRYGGGTRNWATNEPANHSTGAEEETADSERTNSNDGSNDNPDEFSALRDDQGAGIPGK